MTKEEYRQALLNLQEVTTNIRGTPLTEEEIDMMVEKAQELKIGENCPRGTERNSEKLLNP